MKVLFITRKYPPQIGGMENFSYGLINNIPSDKESIILNKKQIHLWWWLPYALIKSLQKAAKADIIHLGDAVLAPLGFILKLVRQRPVVVTVHGLDVTYNNFLYQKVNINCLKYLDKIYCVSESTKKDCLTKGIKPDKLKVIPNGVDVNEFQAIIKKENRQQRLLLTVGRLVKRKGISWFVKEVMPKLATNVYYIIVGTGPEQKNIKAVINKYDLTSRVKLLGYVPTSKLKQLYQQADLFIMPNIKIKGDREGFGIVAIEAAASGLPVVAANIEGLTEAVKEQKNGFLVESGNPDSFLAVINNLLKSNLSETRKQVREYTVHHYSWEVISKRYLDEFKKIINS